MFENLVPPPIVLPWWQKPEWLALVVAALTLICVLVQLRLERRQTRLAERQNEIIENQQLVMDAERARRTAFVMYRKGGASTNFRFYLKNAGDKVAREFVARFWLPETTHPVTGMWDPGGNLPIPGPIEREQIQGTWCMRYERTFRTILWGDSEQAAFYFSLRSGEDISLGTRVFWNVTTPEGEVSPGDEPGAIELA